MPEIKRRIVPILIWTLIAAVPPALAGPLQATQATEAAPAQAAPAVAPAAEELLPNARLPEPGLLTGGQPTPEQFEAIAAAGYRTIIDLRTEGEEGAPADQAEQLAALGLRYVRIPVGGAGDLTEDKARELDRALEEAAGEPAVIHCASGNRVGALLAVRAAKLEGATPEEALEIGLDAGLTRLEPAVRELLGLPPAAP